MARRLGFTLPQLAALVALPAGGCWLAEGEDESRGGRSGAHKQALVSVAFACTRVDVTSSKELSNVVLRYDDGAEQKFDDLEGHSGSFAGAGDHAGKVVVTAWIKSGANHSGDGPGYGERFDAPDEACGTSGAGAGDNPEPPPDPVVRAARGPLE